MRADVAIEFCDQAVEADSINVRARYQPGRAHLKKVAELAEEGRYSSAILGELPSAIDDWKRIDGRKKVEFDAALMSIQMAADHGYAAAQAALGSIFRDNEYSKFGVNDRSKAIFWLTKGARARDVRAEVELGLMNVGDEYAAEGVNKAIPLFMDAAAQGSWSAFSELRCLSMKGKIARSSPAESFYWALLETWSRSSSNVASFSSAPYSVASLGRLISFLSAGREMRRFIATVGWGAIDGGCFLDVDACLEKYRSRSGRLDLVLGRE
jgi:TPR repeat protein